MVGMGVGVGEGVGVGDAVGSGVGVPDEGVVVPEGVAVGVPGLGVAVFVAGGCCAMGVTPGVLAPATVAADVGASPLLPWESWAASTWLCGVASNSSSPALPPWSC
jgi:hypothetical protein